ncbi:hypothetical protein [Streptomonospora litoralis]|uniref:Integrase n=1 Tax=Streptomonospora litoralis TaxID=2498135 RepID=A0A4P6QB55_9ACTN|nr:hypothetical protein [Streptomonospora litoralis]QBI56784.1 hypothetical protein EKD16_25215 [Streptomonospora litoralis]
MPYDIRKRGQKWQVVRRREGDKPQQTIGTHTTKAGAQLQRSAVEAQERRRRR